MKWKFSAVEHTADLVLLVQLQVELGKGSWKSSYSYSQCPWILVCYSEYWKWYTRRKKDQIGPQQKRAKSSWCKEWVMVKHWKQRLWVVNFIEKVDCKLQGYHKKRLKVRGCYIFSMYLIWGRFSNVEMFLAPLLKMCIWGKSVIFGGVFFFFWVASISSGSVCNCCSLGHQSFFLFLYPSEGRSCNWWVEVGFAGQKWVLTVTPKPTGINKAFSDTIWVGAFRTQRRSRAPYFIWALDRCSAADICTLPSISSSSGGVNFCLCTFYLNYNARSLRIKWPKG